MISNSSPDNELQGEVVRHVYRAMGRENELPDTDEPVVAAVPAEIPLFRTEKEAALGIIMFEEPGIVKRGLIRAKRQLRRTKASVEDSAEVVKLILSAPINAIRGKNQLDDDSFDTPPEPALEEKSEAVEAAEPITPEIKEPKRLRKDVYKALGAMAVAGLTLGVAYASSRGYHVHETINSAVLKHPQAIEVIPQNPTPKIPETHALVNDLLSHPAAVKAAHHLHKGVQHYQQLKSSVMVKAGDGYTQVLQRMFPNHTAGTYYEGYKEAVKQFGPNFLRGVGHFKAKQGEWGLSGTGKAHISHAAYQNLASFFRSHR